MFWQDIKLCWKICFLRAVSQCHLGKKFQASSKFYSNKILLYSYYWFFTDYFHRQEIWAEWVNGALYGSSQLPWHWGEIPTGQWHTSDEAISDLCDGPCAEISTFYRRSLSSTIPMIWLFNLVRRNNKSLKCLNEARMWQKLSKKPGEPQGPRPQGGF